ISVPQSIPSASAAKPRGRRRWNRARNGHAVDVGAVVGDDDDDDNSAAAVATSVLVLAGAVECILVPLMSGGMTDVRESSNRAAGVPVCQAPLRLATTRIFRMAGSLVRARARDKAPREAPPPDEAPRGGAPQASLRSAYRSRSSTCSGSRDGTTSRRAFS